MLSDEEIDWIEDRIYTLLEKLIATSNDKYAIEIRELLEIMNEDVQRQRTRISLARIPSPEREDQGASG